jgi:hypothetical protein
VCASIIDAIGKVCALYGDAMGKFGLKLKDSATSSFHLSPFNKRSKITTVLIYAN